MTEKSVKYWIRALQIFDKQVRRNAINNLANLGDSKAVEPLLQILQEDPDNQMRQDAAAALGRLGDVLAVIPLLQSQYDKDSGVQIAAVKALRNLGTENEEIDRIIKGLKGGMWKDRRKTAERLGRLVGTRAVLPLIRGGESDEVICVIETIGKPAVPALIQALTSEYSTVRSTAAKALWRIGDRRAVTPLIRALQDEDSRVQVNSAGALSALGDERAVTPLIKVLEDEDEYVRQFVAWALGRIGDGRAVPFLLETLINDVDEQVRAAAAEGLGNIFGAQEDPAPLLTQVFTVLKCGSTRKRRRVAWALGKVAKHEKLHELIVSVLCEALNDPAWQVQGTALIALEKFNISSEVLIGYRDDPSLTMAEFLIKIKDGGASVDDVPKLVGSTKEFSQVLPLLYEALTDEAWDVRMGAATALGKLCDERAIFPLVNALQNPNERNMVQSRIAEALNSLGWQPRTVMEQVHYYIAKSAWDEVKKFGNPAVVPLSRLIQEGDIINSEAINVLGAIGDARAVLPLTQMFRKKLGFEFVIREALDQISARTIRGLIEAFEFPQDLSAEEVAKALGDLGGPRVVEPLIQLLLVGRSSSTKKAAVKALIELGDPQAVEPLIQLLRDERSPSVQEVAAKALGDLDDPRAVEPLIQALQGRVKYVRKAAARGLGKHIHREVKQRLSKLSAKDLYVQKYITEVLRLFEAVRALEALDAALKDDYEVKSEASKALKQIEEEVVTALGELQDPQTIHHLLEILKDTDNWIVWGVIVEAIGNLKDPRAVKSLLQAYVRCSSMGSERYIRPYKAITALTKIGDRAILPLIKALTSDPAGEVRETAAKTLGQFRDKRVVETLIQALQDPEEGVRRVAAYELWNLKDEGAVERLIQVLEEEGDPQVRKIAAETLGKIEDQKAVKPLIRALQDEEEDVQWAAAIALEQIGDEQAVEALARFRQEDLDELDNEVGYWIRVLENHNESPEDRKAAITELGKLDDERALLPLLSLLIKWDNNDLHKAARNTILMKEELAIDILSESLKTGVDGSGRRGIISMLKALGTEQVVPPLIEALLTDPDYSVREAAVLALKPIKDPRVVPSLIEALQLLWKPTSTHDSRDVSFWGEVLKTGVYGSLRKTITQSLEMLGDKRTVELLIQALQDKNEWVRLNITELLGKLGDSQATLPLSEILVKDPFLEAREKAAWALGKIQDPRAIPFLIEALQSDTIGEDGQVGEVGLAARKALISLRSPQVVSLLVTALKSEVDYSIRRALLRALDELGELDAINDKTSN